jgi:hypothetical protein
MITRDRARLVGISLRIDDEVAKQHLTEGQLAERIGLDPLVCGRKLALRGDQFTDREIALVRDALGMPARWPYTAASAGRS